jgi:hypothetical protein
MRPGQPMASTARLGDAKQQRRAVIINGAARIGDRSHFSIAVLLASHSSHSQCIDNKAEKQRRFDPGLCQCVIVIYSFSQSVMQPA